MPPVTTATVNAAAKKPFATVHVCDPTALPVNEHEVSDVENPLPVTWTVAPTPAELGLKLIADVVCVELELVEELTVTLVTTVIVVIGVVKEDVVLLSGVEEELAATEIEFTASALLPIPSLLPLGTAIAEPVKFRNERMAIESRMNIAKLCERIKPTHAL